MPAAIICDKNVYFEFEADLGADGWSIEMG